MLRIVRNFYKDPDAMREMALNSKYILISNGNFPGKDTIDRRIHTPELERNIKKLFPGDNYKVLASRFRYTKSGDTYMSYVHCDTWGKSAGWHILVYLTKDPPIRDGLTFYKSKSGAKYQKTAGEAVNGKFPEWTPWKEIEYEYNMAVIVDYSYYHAPMNRGGFGDCIENARLLHIIEVIDINSPSNKYRPPIERIGMPGQHHPDCGQDDDEPLSGSDAKAVLDERVEHLEN